MSIQFHTIRQTALLDQTKVGVLVACQAPIKQSRASCSHGTAVRSAKTSLQSAVSCTVVCSLQEELIYHPDQTNHSVIACCEGVGDCGGGGAVMCTVWFGGSTGAAGGGGCGSVAPARQWRWPLFRDTSAGPSCQSIQNHDSMGLKVGGGEGGGGDLVDSLNAFSIFTLVLKPLPN